MRTAIATFLAALVLLPSATALAQSKKTSEAGRARLDAAYKREFAFLEAEKRALVKRLENEKQSANKRVSAAQTEIATLQGRLVAASNEAERLNELLYQAERDVEGLDENTDVLRDILTRAATAYEKVDVTLPDANTETVEGLQSQLKFVFSSVPGALASQGEVAVVKDKYFGPTGKEVEGDVLRVGNIASFGFVEGAAGPLAPAGEGRLKVWVDEGSQGPVAQMAQGGQPSVLPLFIFEALDKPIDQKEGKSLKEFINTGGVIGWVIVVLGCVAMLMVVARALFLWVSSAGTTKVRVPVLSHLERGEAAQALKVAKGASNPAGRVLTATLSNLDKDRSALEDVVAEAVLQEQPRLSRFGQSILIIAAVSPLLGLLGTVTGMISTFDIITEFGTGNPKLLSGGISEALVTTELGLIVAIPSLLLGHILTGWSEGIRDQLDASALAAVNRAHGIDVADRSDDDGSNKTKGGAVKSDSEGERPPAAAPEPA